MRSHGGYYAAIALVSAATLLLELSLLRLFAVQQFYHFAFMAISLALLGAGASGSLLAVWPRRQPPAALCALFSLTTVGAYLVINTLPFDSFSIAWDGRQVLYLALYFLAASLPFLFAGLLVAGELLVAGRQGGTGSHRVYGANLIGSALGGLAALPLLARFGGAGAVMITAVIGLLAGLLFLSKKRAETSAHRRIAWPSLILISLALGGTWLAFRPPPFLKQRLSPYKTLSILSLALDAKHTLTVSDATSRVDVVESSTIHTMPGLSLSSPAALPIQAGLMLDGDNLQPITGLAPEAEEAAILVDHLPLGLAHRLRPQARTLVLEAGAGTDVLWSLAAGASTVTAVEENGLVLETVMGPYADFNQGLFDDPRLTVVNQSGRVYVRQPDRPSYDLVIVSLTDTHRPVTSGAYSLTEEYTYTVEAMRDYLDALEDDGLLVVTRWLQTPPSESGRLFGIMAEALDEIGRDPRRCLFAFRTLRTMTVLAGRQPFEAEEIALARRFLAERGFDPVYFDGLQPAELNRFNLLPEPAYHNLFAAILADPAGTYETYRFDIRPATDDHPFFFHYFKWGQTPEILATLGLTWQPFGGSGFFVLVALLLLVACAAAVFVVGPLLVWRQGGRPPPSAVRWWRGRVAAYFAALGIGFLFVEIPLAQRFILVLDHPVTALAVVLFTILLFSGLGSLTVRRWRLTTALAVLVFTLTLYPFLLTPIASLALAWPGWARVGLTVLVVAPLGYFMGLPFAAGLRLLEALDPPLVPWAWAINGSFSVISSVLAVMVALTWGFSAVLWLGALAYAAALAAFGRLA